MSWRNLIPELHRLGTGRFPEMIKIIEQAIRDNNVPLLRELNRLFKDIDYKLTQARKHVGRNHL